MDGFKKFVTKFKKGDVVYNTGDTQKEFFIINKGKVQLKYDQNEVILASLSKGDFFGEESLSDNNNALYTIEVVEDSDIIKIPYPALKEMMVKSPDISIKILKKLSEKHRKIFDSLFTVYKPQDDPKELTDVAAKPEEEPSEKISPDVKAYLIIQRSNRIVQLTKNHTYLGRRDYTTGFVPDVDLTKEDEEKYISRKHSKISFIDGRFYVSEEPGAVNGTFLNGTRLETGVKHEIKNEDEITLCHLNIIFKF